MVKTECCGNEVKCDDCPDLVLHGTRSAVTDRREQVAGFVRPQQVGSAQDLREQVAEVMEIPDLWKVFIPEWQIVASSDLSGEEGRAEAEAFFRERYQDRVRPEDVRIVPVSQANPDRWPCRLELRLPNQKGEFKRKDLAEDFACEQGWLDDPECKIVPRNSREEHRIRDYGVKKLLGTARAQSEAPQV